MLFSFIEAQELIFLHRRDHNWWPGSSANIEKRINPTCFSLLKYHKLSLNLFKVLMKFVHKRNNFSCFLESSKLVISVLTREGTSYYRAHGDFFSHFIFGNLKVQFQNKQ